MKNTGQIDYEMVRHYFARTSGKHAASASYMAHAQDLPEAASHYRFQKERQTISDWLDAVGSEARVLDLGCGAGTWTEFFAQRVGSVAAIEQSAPMLTAAAARLGRYPNVELLNRDVRDPLPPGPFDLVFFGGLCLYLSDADTIALVRAASERLAVGGRIVLRESTILSGCERAEGTYQAIYRSVDVYRSLFEEAGCAHVGVRRNYAYTDMEIAVELVELRRRYLRILPHTSAFLGALTWWSLRACAPVAFGLFPRAPSWMRLRWPRLQNHFFLLRSVR